jgi:O-antigen/teichoic acid export membrane protein
MKTIRQRDYFWNTTGVLLQNAISPILLMVVARLNGVYDVGLFSFAFSVSIIFYAFGMWGGRTYQVSDVRQEFTSRSYVLMRVILGILMLIGAGVFCVANHYDAFKSMLIITLVLFKVFESVSDALYGVMQIHERLYRTGISLSIKAVGGTISFLVIDIMTHNIFIASLSIILMNVLVFVFYDLRQTYLAEREVFSLQHLPASWRQVFSIMKRCLPVFIVAFLAVFSLNIPRYFIDMFHGEQNGYFGILAMPITLVLLVMTFILQPNIVRLSRLYDKKDYRQFDGIIARIALIVLITGGVILVATYFIGVPALHLVFGIDFAPYRGDLMVIVAGGVINAISSVGINVLTIMRQFIGQFIVLLSTNIMLVVMSLITIKQGGMTAGIWLFTLASTVQMITLYVIYKRRIYRGYYEKKD